MSDYIYTSDGELYHYGVPGMKWGKRKARGHAGPGRYLTRKRQLAGDKKDLEYLNKGGHLSVGLTKKRQAAYDAKDKARLERRITKNEQRLSAKAAKRRLNEQLIDVVNKKVKEARKKSREKFEEDMARKQGGDDAVARLKARRNKKERLDRSKAIAKAKGTEKGKMIVKAILEDYKKETEKRRPKGGNI